ncbi:MAG: OmpA family protein [Myxococcota bacterium]
MHIMAQNGQQASPLSSLSTRQKNPKTFQLLLQGAALMLSVWAYQPEAQAQQAINLQHFAPQASPQGYFNALSAKTMGHKSFALGLTAHYSLNALRAVDQASGETIAVILGQQFQTDVVAGLGLGQRFELSMALPYSPLISGEAAPAYGLEAPKSSALGDLRYGIKAHALRAEEGLNIGVALEGTVPTGDAASFQGRGAASFTPMLLTEYRTESLRTALNVGYAIQPEQTLSSLTLGNELVYAVGVGVAVLPSLDVILDANGRLSLGDVATTTTSPLEAHVGGRLRLGDAHVLSLGVGRAVVPGYGAPEVRGFIGYTFAPSGKTRARDEDKDGLFGAADKCPTEAEDKDNFEDSDGCPELDNDADGLADDADKCPTDAEDKDGFEDTDGCPEIDNDMDGVLDASDGCPNQAELMNGIEDTDGCPEGDQDLDKIVDPVDKCPTQAELINGVEDSDGCPEPDQDGDGVLDANDKCPKKAESKNGIKDDDGCPEPDADGDGIIDELDKCVKRPENKNGLLDEDGCPEADQDNDRIIDEKDKCPRKPETVNGFQDEDGCPDEPMKTEGSSEQKPAEQKPAEPPTPEQKPAEAKPAETMDNKTAEAAPVKMLAPKTLKLLVFFGPDAPTLDARSEEVLMKTLDYLKAFPGMKVQLLGFSDDSGDAAKDMEASQARAESVKGWLVSKGVAADRLEVKAMGNKFPRSPNTTEQGKAGNRRVRLLPINKAGKPQEELPANLEVALPEGL